MYKTAILVVMSIFTLIIANSAMAESQLNPYSCIYERVGNGDWYHNTYWGEKVPVTIGDNQDFILNAMSIGPTGSEFGAVCSGIFANDGKEYLFDQMASGINLSYTKIPTCMLTGNNISATSDFKAIAGNDLYLASRKVFVTSDKQVELFYIIGIKAEPGPDKVKCDQIFISEVGVVPK